MINNKFSFFFKGITYIDITLIFDVSRINIRKINKNFFYDMYIVDNQAATASSFNFELSNPRRRVIGLHISNTIECDYYLIVFSVHNTLETNSTVLSRKIILICFGIFISAYM